MTAAPDGLEVAEQLFAAIEAGDVEAVRHLYSPDVEVWNTATRMAQTAEENLRVLSWLVTNLSDVRYTEIRRQVTAGGFVQEHVLTATRRDGVAIAMPACIVATVVDGQITRLAEYLDSADVARVIAP